MRWAPLAATALALVGIARESPADSWGPYGTKRVPDPTGRWYVVLTGSEKEAWGAEFTFVEAAAGSERVTATATERFEKPKEGDGVRPGDRVVAKGTLANAPLQVRVSSTGAGFAAMDEYGGRGYGNSFVWVTPTGAVRHVKRLADLFSAEEIRDFSHSVSSIHWFQAAWLDEAANGVVVVGRGDRVRVVELVTGSVRLGGTEDVLPGLRNPDPRARVDALDLLERTDPVVAAPHVLPLYADAAEPVPVRLRAAVILGRAGDPGGKELVRAVATSATSAIEDRRYAVSRLHVLLGTEAMPVLRETLRGPTKETWAAAEDSFVALGDAAVDTLLAMLAETEAGYRQSAAQALGKIRSARSLAPLLAAVRDPSEPVAGAALRAAVATAGPSISKDLAALLDAKTTQDASFGVYFEKVREPASVAPLVRALRRHPENDFPRSALLDALVFQAGVDLGPETSAWEAWLAKRPR